MEKPAQPATPKDGRPPKPKDGKFAYRWDGTQWVAIRRSNAKAIYEIIHCERPPRRIKQGGSIHGSSKAVVAMLCPSRKQLMDMPVAKEWFEGYRAERRTPRIGPVPVRPKAATAMIIATAIDDRIRELSLSGSDLFDIARETGLQLEKVREVLKAQRQKILHDRGHMVEAIKNRLVRGISMYARAATDDEFLERLKVDFPQAVGNILQALVRAYAELEYGRPPADGRFAGKDAAEVVTEFRELFGELRKRAVAGTIPISPAVLDMVEERARNPNRKVGDAVRVDWKEVQAAETNGKVGLVAKEEPPSTKT